MDRNATTGIILITLLVLVWYYFIAPRTIQPVPQAENPQTTITENLQKEESKAEIVIDTVSTKPNDSLANEVLKDRYADFFAVAEGEEQLVQVETNDLKIYVSSKGGRIVEARLKEYNTYDSLTLPIILNEPSNKFSLLFEYKGREINTSDLFFVPSSPSLKIEGDSSQTLTMTAQLSADKSLVQEYEFFKDGYKVNYNIIFNGFQNDLKNSFYEILWDLNIPKTELSIKNMRQKTTIAYGKSKDVEKLGYTDDAKSENLSLGVDWLSYKSQFFSSILIGEKAFRSAKLNMTTPENDTTTRNMSSNLYVDMERAQNSKQAFTFYLGPNEYTRLRSFEKGLEKQMDLGWWIVSYINVGTVYIFKFLEKYISNYGFIILIFAFLIKVGLFPLTYKNYVSMAKLRVLNSTPEMKALDEKHKDEPQKLQMAKMGIYKEMGVNMFGGCLPMILQYPFLIAMFFFFPQSVELRQKSFLWAQDLSTYDSVLNLPFTIPFYGDHVSLFTILMAISIFIYTYFSQKSQPTSANPQMKYIAYFMPVIFLVFLNNYASGLSLYYFASNLISIAQTTFIRYTLDDEKLLDQMRKNQKTKGGKGKNKKGGTAKKSRGRLESWVEKQQKKQEEMMKQRKQMQKGGNSRQSRRKNR